MKILGFDTDNAHPTAMGHYIFRLVVILFLITSVMVSFYSKKDNHAITCYSNATEDVYRIDVYAPLPFMHIELDATREGERSKRIHTMELDMLADGPDTFYDTMKAVDYDLLSCSYMTDPKVEHQPNMNQTGLEIGSKCKQALNRSKGIWYYSMVTIGILFLYLLSVAFTHFGNAEMQFGKRLSRIIILYDVMIFILVVVALVRTYDLNHGEKRLYADDCVLGDSFFPRGELNATNAFACNFEQKAFSTNAGMYWALFALFIFLFSMDILQVSGSRFYKTLGKSQNGMIAMASSTAYAAMFEE